MVHQSNASPPGEFLREELEARGWSQVELAEILGRPPRLVNEILSGKKAITPETAHGLGMAFGTGPEFWMNLESAYQLAQSKTDTTVAKRARLYEKAPIRAMVRRNWIEPSNDLEVLERQVLAFLGVKSIDEEPEALQFAARKSTAYDQVSAHQWAWFCRCRQLAKSVTATKYREQNLPQVVEKLRLLFGDPEEVRKASRVLSESGIRLVIVEALATTRIDGACFWLDPESPVVAISLRYDRIDWFWFTLLHELGHVKAKDGLLSSEPTLDVDLVGEGAQSSSDKPVSERNADQFASETLLDSGALTSFIKRTRPLYSDEKIRFFSARMGVHPGIVVGQLQHRKEIPYSHFRDRLVKVRNFVTRSALTDGWGALPPVLVER